MEKCNYYVANKGHSEAIEELKKEVYCNNINCKNYGYDLDGRILSIPDKGNPIRKCLTNAAITDRIPVDNDGKPIEIKTSGKRFQRADFSDYQRARPGCQSETVGKKYLISKSLEEDAPEALSEIQKTDFRAHRRARPVCQPRRACPPIC